MNEKELAQVLKALADEQLVAQDLIHYGSIHAINYLLATEFTREHALQMLATLRVNSQVLRNEAQRRGKPELLPSNEIALH